MSNYRYTPSSSSHVSTTSYPYPDTKSDINQFCIDQYETDRMVWRASLSDSVVRALASDYRLGKHSEENYDAHLEYFHRKLDEKPLVSSTKPRKRKKSK